MSVYVDDMRAPYKHMVMCHMIADSSAELLQMATWLGLDHKYLQDKGTDREHFDISRSKRKLAVEIYGAYEITQKELCKRLIDRRTNGRDAGTCDGVAEGVRSVSQDRTGTA